MSSTEALSKQSLRNELDLARQLAYDAGKVLMQYFGKPIHVDSKGADGPVTEADRQANRVIVSGLSKAFMTDGIVAEETPDRSDALRGGRCWYVDPLDGTKEFIQGRDDFSVMIGLAIDGQASLGVVYQPTTDKLYEGVVHHGARLHQHGSTKDLAVSTLSNTSELTMVISKSHRSSKNDIVMQRLGITKEFSSGSVGLKIGLIADRAADIYLLPSERSCLWDSCGPEAILLAAGGRMTTMAGEPIYYGGDDIYNRKGILACNATAYDHVLPTVKAVAESYGLI